MNASTQRLCVWSGPLLIVLFTGGFVVAGFLPPPAPSQTAEQVRQLFIDDQFRIRVGLVLLLFGAALSFPWVGVLTIHVKRVEGRWAPLALTQFAAGLILSLPFMFPTMVWGAAAYRPHERSPELTQGLNDLAWLPFIGIGTNSIVQSLAIALVILRDKGERPVFPRWSAYFNIWVAALLAPGCLVIFFQSGPFAWNGLFAFWVPLTAFGSWFVVMAVLLFRAIAAQQDEEIEALSVPA
jgi:hypothetical protein